MYQAKTNHHGPLKIDQSWIDAMEILYNDDNKPVAVIFEGRKYAISLVPNSTPMISHIFVEGIPFQVELLREIDLVIESLGYNKRRELNQREIVAPIPGHVIRIEVVAGQKIEKGSKLLALEAMKMENTVFAPEQGTVKEVFVRQGQTVNKGDKLIELE